MKPGFALSLARTGVSLMHRSPRGWLLVGEAALDDPDFDSVLSGLRARALALSPGAITTKLVIPETELLYTTVETTSADPEARRATIRAALEGATPYPVDELVFDCSGSGGVLNVAVVARETLDEAEAFATQQGFNPVSFVAVPNAGRFIGEPFFGETACAASLLESGEKVERDLIPVAVVGKAAAPQPAEARALFASTSPIDPAKSDTPAEPQPGTDTGAAATPQPAATETATQAEATQDGATQDGATRTEVAETGAVKSDDHTDPAHVRASEAQPGAGPQDTALNDSARAVSDTPNTGSSDSGQTDMAVASNGPDQSPTPDSAPTDSPASEAAETLDADTEATETAAPDKTSVSDRGKSAETGADTRAVSTPDTGSGLSADNEHDGVATASKPQAPSHKASKSTASEPPASAPDSSTEPPLPPPSSPPAAVVVAGDETGSSHSEITDEAVAAHFASRRAAGPVLPSSDSEQAPAPSPPSRLGFGTKRPAEGPAPEAPFIDASAEPPDAPPAQMANGDIADRSTPGAAANGLNAGPGAGLGLSLKSIARRAGSGLEAARGQAQGAFEASKGHVSRVTAAIKARRTATKASTAATPASSASEAVPPAVREPQNKTAASLSAGPTIAGPQKTEPDVTTGTGAPLINGPEALRTQSRQPFAADKGVSEEEAMTVFGARRQSPSDPVLGRTGLGIAAVAVLLVSGAAIWAAYFAFSSDDTTRTTASAPPDATIASPPPVAPEAAPSLSLPELSPGMDSVLGPEQTPPDPAAEGFAPFNVDEAIADALDSLAQQSGDAVPADTTADSTTPAELMSPPDLAALAPQPDAAIEQPAPQPAPLSDEELAAAYQDSGIWPFAPETMPEGAPQASPGTTGEIDAPQADAPAVLAAPGLPGPGSGEALVADIAPTAPAPPKAFDPETLSSDTPQQEAPTLESGLAAIELMPEVNLIQGAPPITPPTRRSAAPRLVLNQGNAPLPADATPAPRPTDLSAPASPGPDAGPDAPAAPDAAASDPDDQAALAPPAGFDPAQASAALPSPSDAQSETEASAAAAQSDVAVDSAETLRTAIAILPEVTVEILDAALAPGIPAPRPAGSVTVVAGSAPAPSSTEETAAESTPEPAEGQLPPGAIGLAALRPPGARPDALAAQAAQRIAEEAARAEALANASPLAVAQSPLPSARPQGFDTIVARTQAASTPATAAQSPEDPSPQPAAPAQAAAPAAPAAPTPSAQPSIPTRASVAQQATEGSAINLRQVNLIGVFGTPSQRRALVRMPNGQIVAVRVGDRLDGGQVAAIGDGELRYIKNGQNTVLRVGDS